MQKRSYVLLLLFLLSFFFYSCQSSHSGKTPPKAINGVLDLRSWNFEQDGPVDLSGGWEFYWEQLLDGIKTGTGTSFHADGMFEMPSRWEGYTLSDGRVLTHLGYATFKLKILLPAPSSPSPHLSRLALKTGMTDSAYSLQVFSDQGELLGKPLQGGIVGINRESTTPTMRFEKSILSYAPVWILTYKVSNFHYFFGGVELAPEMGTPEQLQHKQTLLKFVDFASVGLLWIMGVYHLILFALHPKDRSTLCFGLLCVLMSAYLLFSQLHLASAFPHVYLWTWYTNLAFQCVSWISVLFMIFIRLLFFKHASQTPFYIITGILLATSAVLLLFPLSSAIAKIAYSALLFALFLAILWIFYVLTRAAWAKEQTAQILFIGFLFLAVAIIHDVSLQIQIIKNAELIAPYGLSFFILAQALVIAMKNQKAHRDKVFAQNQAIENLNKSDALKDEFLANTSHELRTPLHGIIGIAESLIDGAAGGLPQKARENLSLVTQSGKRLSTLIDDILDFSKMKHQDLQLQLKAIDMKSTVDLILTLSLPLLNQKNIQLLNQIPDDLPLVEADENRLQQILMNLIGNAIKFTQEGSITVSAQQENERLRIFVKDTGIGIPVDQQHLIFESFEQLDGSISREYTGTGLGLTVTKQLVALHGGVIEVQSVEGEGSCFLFTLSVANERTPIMQASEVLIRRPKSHKEEEAAYAATSGRSLENEEDLIQQNAEKTILVVDDEPVNIQVLNNQLSLHHYRFISAQDGFEALKILEDCIPDLILLDLMMPGMSGYEVCQIIRESHSPSDLPILILTAKNQVKDLVEGLESGANDYLSKPFSKQELISRIQTQLTLSEQNTALKTQAKTLEYQVQERTQRISKNMELLKQTQAQLVHSERMSSLGNLVAGVAHEINNPVQSISVTTDNLKQNLDDLSQLIFKLGGENAEAHFEKLFGTHFKKLGHNLSNLKEGSLRIKNIVQDLRTFSRLDEAEQKQVKLVEGIHSTLNLLKAQYRQIEFMEEYLAQPELECWPAQLNQVYMNVMVNACQAIEVKQKSSNETFQGSLYIRTFLFETNKTQNVGIEFTDNGCGMSQEIQSQIFDPFFTSKKVGEGTGLGMSISYGIIEKHSGRISVQSKENEGSTVLIELPLKETS